MRTTGIPNRLRAAAAGAAIALLAVTGCGGSDDGGSADAKPEPGASAEKDAGGAGGGDGGGGKDDPLAGVKIPDGLPTSPEELKGFDWDDWKNWEKQKKFVNPRIKGLWTPERMRKALAADLQVTNLAGGDSGPAEPGTDPIPDPVKAQEQVPPFTKGGSARLGKLFFDSPEGPSVCSATVVSDPENQGKSNLVWTAGHCVEGGSKGGWMRNIVFVPAYNNNGRADEASYIDDPAISPYGVWRATQAVTSKAWDTGGSMKSGNDASHYDFAVLRVAPEPRARGAKELAGRSVEEVVGGSVPMWFDAPKGLEVSAWGYPAAAPYNGLKMFHCEDEAVSLVLDARAESAMPWIGCSMTGGSSGGGWFAENKDGEVALVGNNSIGDAGGNWLASPYLGKTAEQVYEAMVKAKG